MEMVRIGADRQEIHEAIRVHAQAAAAEVKLHGRSNDLVERLRTDARFAPVHDRLDAMLDPKRHVGRAPQQVHAFVAQEVTPALAPWRDRLVAGQGLRV